MPNRAQNQRFWRKAQPVRIRCTVLPYNDLVNILRFRHKGLKRLYERGDPRGVSRNRVHRIANILSALEAAADISQLATMPGWKLHRLHGEREGEYSISVTGNWRITFRLDDGAVTDVNLEDYH